MQGSKTLGWIVVLSSLVYGLVSLYVKYTTFFIIVVSKPQLMLADKWCKVKVLNLFGQRNDAMAAPLC